MKLFFTFYSATVMAALVFGVCAKEKEKLIGKDEILGEDESYWGRFVIDSADSFVTPTASPIAATTLSPTGPPFSLTSAPVAPTDAPIAPTDAPVAPTDAPIAPVVVTPVPTESPTETPVAPTRPPTLIPSPVPSSAPVAASPAPSTTRTCTVDVSLNLKEENKNV